MSIRLVVLFVTIAAASTSAMAQEAASEKAVTIKDAKAPTAGNASTIVTDGVVESLTMTYSPSSNVAEVETVKANGTEMVLWRPLRPGVVEISAPGHASKRISVRFDGVPFSGVAIMLIAGFILFGGAFVSLRLLLAEGK